MAPVRTWLLFTACTVALLVVGAGRFPSVVEFDMSGGERGVNPEDIYEAFSERFRRADVEDVSLEDFMQLHHDCSAAIHSAMLGPPDISVAVREPPKKRPLAWGGSVCFGPHFAISRRNVSEPCAAELMPAVRMSSGVTNS